jgi:hypothetical protein
MVLEIERKGRKNPFISQDSHLRSQKILMLHCNYVQNEYHEGAHLI